MSQETLILECPRCGARNRVLMSRRKDAVCGRCKTSLAFPIGPIAVTDSTFEEEVLRSPIPVVVEFWTPTCGACRQVAPVIQALARELAGKVVFATMDASRNMATALRFRVQGVPTFLFFRSGLLLDTMVGAASKEAILYRVQRLIGIGAA